MQCAGHDAEVWHFLAAGGIPSSGTRILQRVQRKRKVFDKPTELVTRDKEQNIYSYNV
jgi:hypothetical protein